METRASEENQAFVRSMKTDDLWVIGGGSIFLLIGAGIFWLGARNLSRALASRHWPQTSGVVASADTTAETTRDSRYRGSSSDRDSSTMYSANIPFRYQVSG